MGASLIVRCRQDQSRSHKYVGRLQNFIYFVGSLEQTLQRDANDAIINGPASAAEYPARPLVSPGRGAYCVHHLPASRRCQICEVPAWWASAQLMQS